MSMFSGDLIIRSTLLLGLEDIRKNPWLIEEMFSDLLEHPVLADKYGMAEITRAKEFIMNNEIPVFLKYRIDKEEVPCITVSMGGSVEDKSLATLADLDIDSNTYTPDQINKPIQYIVKPVNLISYDDVQGIIQIDVSETNDFRYVRPGMAAIDPDTGDGFVIIDVVGDGKFTIQPGLEIESAKLGIIPKYQYYKARKERIVSQESYNIGVHAHGDPASLIFLFTVVKYILLRYREDFLEAYNFQLSNISCSDMVKNGAFDNIGENVYSRFITLSGQAEESWVKMPKRIIEAIDVVSNENEVLRSGIKILSNETHEDEDSIWETIDDDSQE